MSVGFRPYRNQLASLDYQATGNHLRLRMLGQEQVEVFQRRQNPKARHEQTVEGAAAERQGQRQPFLQNPDHARRGPSANACLDTLKLAKELPQARYGVSLIV